MRELVLRIVSQFFRISATCSGYLPPMLTNAKNRFIKHTKERRNQMIQSVTVLGIVRAKILEMLVFLFSSLIEHHVDVVGLGNIFNTGH